MVKRTGTANQQQEQAQDQNTQQAAQVAPQQEMPPMHLDVRVRPIKPMGNLLGYADATINGNFAVTGIKVVSGRNGLFANMPSMPDSKGGYREVCFPVTKEFHHQLNQAVVTGYQQAIEQMQTAALEAQQRAQEAQEMGEPDMAEPAMAQ